MEGPEELLYTASTETSIMLMREICRLIKLARDEVLMIAVAKQLQEWGVDFTNASEEL